MSNPLFDIVFNGIMVVLCLGFIKVYWHTRLSIKLKNKAFLELKSHLQLEEQQSKLNNEKVLLADNLNKLCATTFFEIAKDLILAYQTMFDKKT